MKRRSASLVNLLLEADADPKYRIRWSVECAFLRAAHWADHCVMKALVFAGATRGHVEGYNEAVAIATKGHDHELIRLLLKADSDYYDDPPIYEQDTALSLAAEWGDIGMARYLLDQGMDPHDLRAVRKAYEGNQATFDLLLKEHAARHPGHRCGLESAILMEVIQNGDIDGTKMMLQRGSEANRFVALEQEKVSYLGPETRGQSNHFMTPFGLAILKTQDSTREILVDLLLTGCDPNSIVSQYSREKDNVRLSPLRSTAFLTAISTGEVWKVEVLLRYGADVNMPARMGVKRTPLQAAAERGSIDIIELLLREGANVNAPPAQRGGGTALQLAAIGGHFQVACMLLDHNAKVDAAPSKVYGRTALEGAAEHGRLDMVKFLLNAGAGSKGKDRAQFEKASSLARENGYSYICDLLQEHLDQNAVDEFVDYENGFA